MAQLSKSDFNTLYGQPSGTTFPDNTTQEISANDVRQQGEDIKDSFLNRTDDFIDEDSFASDSATKVPSQQSTKAYIASQINANLAGLNWKQSVTVRTTANITLSGEQTIDGVLTSSSRVLVMNQSTASQNGIYVSASGAWARATDNDSTAEMQGAVVGVDQGTTHANTTWRQSEDSVTIGSSTVTWVSFGAAGITNGAANNEITKSNGTNIIGTKIYSSTDGSMTLGDNTIVTAERAFTADGSGSNVGFAWNPKGSGGYQFNSAGGDFLISGNDSTSFNIIQAGAGTNNISTTNIIRRTTSGTAAAGFGIGFTYELENGSGGLPVAATWEYSWADATNTSEDVIISLKGIVGGSLTTLMQWSSGNFGAFGVTPVARQVVPTGSTTDQVITALQNLGWFSQT